MKKLLTILLSLFVVFTLAACNNGGGESGNNGGTDAPQTIKIGVATQFEGDQWVVQKDYYEKELAPALGVEFMISEKISDANGLVDFIDQAYAAECQGVLNYLTQSEPVQQGARKCEEYGMFFVTQNSRVVDEVATLEHNMGHCGADPMKMGAAYKTLFNEILSDGENHSLFLYSCGAPGQMAASHYYSSLAILEAFRDAYGLTFEKSLEDIVNAQEPSEYATGRDDIKLYVYPGIDFETIPLATQTVLQDGDYDIFAACAMFQAFTSGIDAVEKALNKDIMIVGTVGIDDAAKAGFNTQDSFGNPVLNAGMINPLNPANGVDTAMLINGILGNGANMKDNGKAVLVGVAPFVCKDAATYDQISKLDTSVGNYVLSGEDIKALTPLGGGTVTYKDIDAKLNQIADIEYVLKSRGH